VVCGLGPMFRIGFTSLLHYFGSTPKTVFLFGPLVKSWYSTDVTGLKLFADRSRSIFACALSGGKNTFFTSWLKTAHPGYKPDEDLGLTKVGPFNISFFHLEILTAIHSSFFLCPLPQYESVALEYWNIELRTTFNSYTTQICEHLSTLLPNTSDVLTIENLQNHVHDGADFEGITLFFSFTTRSTLGFEDFDLDNFNDFVPGKIKKVSSIQSAQNHEVPSAPQNPDSSAAISQVAAIAPNTSDTAGLLVPLTTL